VAPTSARMLEATLPASRGARAPSASPSATGSSESKVLQRTVTWRCAPTAPGGCRACRPCSRTSSRRSEHSYERPPGPSGPSIPARGSGSRSTNRRVAPPLSRTVLSQSAKRAV
jgi:hypothetical protein